MTLFSAGGGYDKPNNREWGFHTAKVNSTRLIWSMDYLPHYKQTSLSHTSTFRWIALPGLLTLCMLPLEDWTPASSFGLLKHPTSTASSGCNTHIYHADDVGAVLWWSFVHATEHLKVGIQVKCDNSLLRNAHDQSQITNVAWLDNSSLVSTGQVFFINFVS